MDISAELRDLGFEDLATEWDQATGNHLKALPDAESQALILEI